jgi:hypothetical protein
MQLTLLKATIHSPKGGKMTLRRLAFPVICLLFVALGTAAKAQTWTYTFSGTNSAPGGDGLSAVFQYSTQAPITADTLLLSSQLISCTNCLVSSIVPATVFEPSNVFGSSVQFNDVENVGSVYMFPFGSFSKPGTYSSQSGFNPGTLTVQVVPEPGSFACTGFQSPFDVAILLSKKTNRAIPLKAQLFDSGNNLVTPTTLGTASMPVVNVSYQSGTTPAVDNTALLDPLGQSSSGNQFNFDPTTETWWFNLATTPFAASGTYTVTLQSGDASYQLSSQCSGQFVKQ